VPFVNVLTVDSFLIVDYEHSNFSISQAAFDPNAPSQIVSIISNASTAITGATNANPTSSNGPIVKTASGSGSHGIGTGAIAGIAIAIVLIASLCGAFFVFRSLKRRRNSKKAKFEELEGEPKFIPDIDQDSKHDYSHDLETAKKPMAAATVTAVDSPMTPPLSEVDGGYFAAINGKERYSSNIIELPGSPGSHLNRSEMGSPEPPELESPEPEALRSELSTPEPRLAWELPSPDPSHEMPVSPGISSVSSSQPSPPLIDNRCSGLNSPQQLPIQRPTSDRFDSSESEAGWTRDGMPHRPFHRRYNSSESLQSRPSHSRMGSSDSDGFIHSDRIDESTDSEAFITSAAEVVFSPVLSRPGLVNLDSSEPEAAVLSPSQQIPRRPVNARTDSSSDSEAPTPGRATFRHVVGLTRPFHSSASSRPAIRRSLHAVTRPFSCRTDSSDSDAWQTRLDSASTENPSDVSRFPSVRHSRGASNGAVQSRDGLLEEDNERLEGS